MNESQVLTALEKLNGWKLENGFIKKSFQFKDFKAAFAFMVRVSFEAEDQNHHPNWENVYNVVTVRLQTHDAAGITHKDIELARSIDAIE